MSENNRNGQHVRWEVFVVIISLITVVFGYFANRVDTKLDVIGNRIHEIDKNQAILQQRTKVLEGLTPNETNMIRNGIQRALNSFKSHE